MEINNPNGNPADPFYVTNGLLVVEMISGNMQTGANSFSPLSPSDVQIAGDAGSDFTFIRGPAKCRVCRFAG